MNRKALFLLFGYYPEDPRVRREAEALHEAGWEVDAWCTSRSGAEECRVVNGVKMTSIPLVKHRRGLFHYLAQYVQATRMYRQLLQQRVANGYRPDVILVATLPDFLVLAARPARGVGTKVVLDLHEAMPEFFASKFGREKAWLATGLLRAVERNSANQADLLMTVNDVIADNFQSRLGRRPIVIYNSPDTTLFGPMRSPAPRKKGRAVVFGYHGTITHIYGLDLLLQACAMLRDRGLPFSVRVIGDGPERAALEAMAKEGGLDDVVVFTGRLPLEHMMSVLETVDVGVVPTRKDAFLDMSLGTKLLEYVHLGRPVVASDLRAVQHVFPRESTLYYFKGNSPEDLAAAMSRVAKEAPGVLADRARQAQCAYSTIVWEKMKERLLAAIQDLLEGGK